MIPQLTSYLKEFITPGRFELLQRILENRTRYITVVLEDIFQPQNASAVVRSCDCFGIHDLHTIETRNDYIIDREVAMGSDKWVNVMKYHSQTQSSLNVLNQLKSDGYRIVATTPRRDSIALDDFDLMAGKVALFFGTELTGLSPTILDHADEYLRIPMYGFTESFNISVSVAIILHHLNLQLRHSDIGWQLPQHEKELILYRWVKASVKKVDLILDKYCQQNNLSFSQVIKI
ncbi:MAG: RNA methyltransferase [Salinivirgaceae bacterium]|nr:RNA methyltransferase [Salinivirgaceae bacterium]